MVPHLPIEMRFCYHFFLLFFNFLILGLLLRLFSFDVVVVVEAAIILVVVVVSLHFAVVVVAVDD